MGHERSIIVRSKIGVQEGHGEGFFCDHDRSMMGTR